MDGQRPPRSVRPHSLQQSPRSPAPAYADPSRPSLVSPDSRTNVSFQNTERGDRNSQLDAPRQRNMPSAYHAHLPYTGDPESPELSDVSKVGRKKSLVRPDREKIDPGHRQWHYRSHVAQLEQEGNARVGVMPSSASAESFLQVHLIDFFLRIQQRETSHNRTPSDEDSHSLAVRRMCMNQASHSSNVGP